MNSLKVYSTHSGRGLLDTQLTRLAVAIKGKVQLIEVNCHYVSGTMPFSPSSPDRGI